MLKVRLLTAAVLLPMVLAAFIWGPSFFIVLFLLACSALTTFEVAALIVPTFERRLAGHDLAPHADDGATKLHPLRVYLFPVVAIGLGWIVLLSTVNSSAAVSIGMITLAALAALLIGSFSARSIDLAVARAFGILISLCYGAFPWLVIWQLYEMGPRSKYVLLVMAVTWAGDTGGYFGGRYLGGKIFRGRKLAPVISPKKTWEGAIVGLLLSVVGAWILNMCYMNQIGSTVFLAKLALVGGVFAQLGDLVESSFKRFAGVKDSGFIIPGHGGFLDRVDGILFAAPVIWAILYFFR